MQVFIHISIHIFHFEDHTSAYLHICILPVTAQMSFNRSSEIHEFQFSQHLILCTWCITKNAHMLDSCSFNRMQTTLHSKTDDRQHWQTKNPVVLAKAERFTRRLVWYSKHTACVVSELQLLTTADSVSAITFVHFACFTECW